MKAKLLAAYEITDSWRRRDGAYRYQVTHSCGRVLHVETDRPGPKQAKAVAAFFHALHCPERKTRRSPWSRR